VAASLLRDREESLRMMGWLPEVTSRVAKAATRLSPPLDLSMIGRALGAAEAAKVEARFAACPITASAAHGRQTRNDRGEQVDKSDGWASVAIPKHYLLFDAKE
jgi:hypothetical protein